MSVDITKFVCSNAELVHKMRKFKFYKLLQMFMSGGFKFYVSLANIGRSVDFIV